MMFCGDTLGAFLVTNLIFDMNCTRQNWKTSCGLLLLKKHEWTFQRQDMKILPASYS